MKNFRIVHIIMGIEMLVYRLNRMLGCVAEKKNEIKDKKKVLKLKKSEVKTSTEDIFLKPYRNLLWEIPKIYSHTYAKKSV